MLTRRKFLATSAMGLWLPTVFGASPIMTRRVVLSKTESEPDMLWQTTRVGLFNPTITKTGLPVEWDYGDGSARELTNAPSHTYAATGIKNVGIRLRDAASLVTTIKFQTQSIISPPANFNAFFNLDNLWININSPPLINGRIPDFTSCTKMLQLLVGSTGFTEVVPPLAGFPLLIVAQFHLNMHTGSTPSLSGNTALAEIRFFSNQITGYTASTIALSVNNFRIENNLLPQSAVDQIAADFATNIASRPATGTLNVGGTGNAAASAAGIANFDLVAAHGFTVTHN